MERQNERRMQIIQRAARFIVDKNIVFFALWIVYMVGSDKLLQWKQISLARPLQQILDQGALSFSSGNVHIEGKENVIKHLEKEILKTFPTWFERLISVISSAGFAGLTDEGIGWIIRGLILMLLIAVLENLDEILDFVRAFGINLLDLERLNLGMGKYSKLSSSLKLDDPINTPEPAFIKKIIK